jgi:hypothetical protein
MEESWKRRGRRSWGRKLIDCEAQVASPRTPKEEIGESGVEKRCIGKKGGVNLRIPLES